MPQHSLLHTKLHVPPVRPELVSRPRLRALTLVSAPAGFGKTTLVSEWGQGIGGATPPITVVWLSLDDGDNDLAPFRPT